MRVLNHPICVDNFGNEVFICEYTSKPVSIGAHIFIGPCIPQLSGTYVCAPDAMHDFRESKRNFDACEANCNTCSNFARLPHAKGRGRFLRGKCDRAPTEHALLYMRKGQEFWVHPEDSMGMECYVPRGRK